MTSPPIWGGRYNTYSEQFPDERCGVSLQRQSTQMFQVVLSPNLESWYFVSQFDVEIIDTAGLIPENEQRTMQYCLNNADAFSYPDAMDLFRDKVKPVTNEFIAKFKK